MIIFYPGQVKVFQSQVEIVNLIGTTSLDKIKNVVTVYHTKNKPAFAENTVTDSTNKIITAKGSSLLFRKKMRIKFMWNIMQTKANFYIQLKAPMRQAFITQ